MNRIAKTIAVSAVSIASLLSTASIAAAWYAPEFPSCTSFSTNGDWSTGVGNHHIPGQEATIFGKDDVYYVQNGNFVQCLCPPNGQGVQTNWWNISGMGQSEIDNKWKPAGWYHEQGSNWNLMNYPYLAKNTSYQCATVTPTPTPTTTITPSVTPTVSVTPTATPTNPPSNNPPSNPPSAPVCTDVSPEVPTLLSVVKSGKDSVDLTWTQPDANVEYYMISYGFESGKYIYGVPNTGKTTSYRVGGLDLSKKYFFVVRSQKGCAPSKASNELSYPRGQVLAAGLANTDSLMETIMKFMTVGAGVVVSTFGAWKLRKMS